MANIKTVTLDGTEQIIRISGQNCCILNKGAAEMYASAKPNIVADADGVLSVPAGGSARLDNSNGTVYLLGTGKVQLVGTDYDTQVFKPAPVGGGTEDSVARTAIADHEANTEIHVTAADKSKWDIGNLPFIADLRNGNLLDHILDSDKSGLIYCCEDVSDMPVDNSYFFVLTLAYVDIRCVIAVEFGTGAIYTNRYNGTVWYGWHNVAGGTA